MAEPVKPRRGYHSPRRQEQAEATRLAILDAAERRFAAQGYAAATVAGIAAEAGVAARTVYLAFESKAGTLRLAAERSRQVKPRAGPLLATIRGAALVDPDAAVLCQRI